MSSSVRDDSSKMARSACNSIQYKNWVITGDPNWRSYKEKWEQLEQHAPPSPFHSVAWVTSWYEIAEASGEAEPLLVTGSYADDTAPVILLALCRTRQFGLDIVCAADLGVSDYFKPLIHTDKSKDLPDGAFSDFFHGLPDVLSKHDLLLLSRLDPSGSSIGANNWPKHNIHNIPVGTWGLDLSDAAAPDIQDRLSVKLRKTLRSKTRAMKRQRQRRVEYHWPLKNTQVLDSVLQMQSERLDEIGRKSPISQRPWNDLYRRLISANDPKTFMAATVLYDGITQVAGAIGIVSGSSFVGLVLTFKHGPADRYSPGMQVVLETIVKAQQEGIQNFELSIGDQPYKKSFGCQRRPLYTILVPRTVKGRVAWATWQARHFVRTEIARLRLLLTRRRSS
jgi:CelD/BcsL family acetyltransferase involved in cellulose biosynthesis